MDGTRCFNCSPAGVAGGGAAEVGEGRGGRGRGHKHYTAYHRLFAAARSLRGSRCVRAYYPTVEDAAADQVLDWYAMRFSVEQTIRDAKGQLGFEQPQNWSKPAVRRTAPVAMLLYSPVVL